MRKHFKLYLTRDSPYWGRSCPIGQHIFFSSISNFSAFLISYYEMFCNGFPCFRPYIPHWPTTILLLKLNDYCHNKHPFYNFVEFFLFPIIFLHFLFYPLFLWLSLENKKLLVRTYTWKYPHSDIKNEIPLTTHSWLCNRLWWFFTSVLRS